MLERLRFGDALAARALAQPAEQRARRLHAAIGREQRVLQRLVERLVDARPAEQLAEVGAEHGARAREPVLQTRRPRGRC
jgi:hypothetical protein